MEMFHQPMGGRWVFDIEIFKNFFFFAAKKVGVDECFVVYGTENTPIPKEMLDYFVRRHCLIGFNSFNFDVPIIGAALALGSVEAVKKVSDQIIIDKVRRYDFERRFDIPIPPINEIDIMEVCPLKGGLKMYGARLHAKTIQEIPISPENYLMAEEKTAVGNYCINDLALTELLVTELEKELELRKRLGDQYGLDLRSRSDAQIAERVIEAEIKKVTGKKITKPLVPPGTVFRYNKPDWMGFQTEPLQKLLDDVVGAEFVVGPKGSCSLPKVLDGRQVMIGKGVYRLGIGGLHSSEKCQAYRSDKDRVLIDRDVASYYPAIILNQRLYPEHIGPDFIDIYGEIVSRRLEAKKVKSSDADSLKIVINGTYGKFGSKYSAVYSPQLSIQVTMTGQLALLMLIEYAHILGFEVVSANTDGLVFYVERDRVEELDGFIKSWEAHTGFITEETRYTALFSRDVNNYIAIKEDGSTKTNGAYKLPKGSFRFAKNPDCAIVTKAVLAHLTKGEDIATTIEACKDIREFLVVRKVEGGALWAGQSVGSVIRWYFSRHCSQNIEYGSGDKKGDKVPNSEKARVVLELPDEFPNDIDYLTYIEMAQKVLLDIGAVREETLEQRLFSDQDLEPFR